MTRFLAPAAAIVLLGGSLTAQTRKKTTGPTPPTLNEPGSLHPKPIPEQDPAAPPNVRKPVHETGREKAVSSRDKSSQRGKAPKEAQERTRTQTTPETSPKVEQNGQIGGAQDPPARKGTEKGETPRSPQR
jgi:hypothetical protein